VREGGGGWPPGHTWSSMFECGLVWVTLVGSTTSICNKGVG
jgi:hypothetical protein